MTITEPIILHRKVTKRDRGKVYHETVSNDLVPYGFVAELTAEEINRSLSGTRVEGQLKLMIWNTERLEMDDGVELNGNISSPGNGDMYLVLKLLKDMRRIAGYTSYVVKRQQD